MVFDESSNNTLSNNNTINSNRHGILLYSSSNNNDVIGNTFSDNEVHGLILWDSSGNNIIGNHISNNGFAGIDLMYTVTGSLYNRIAENTITNSDYGIILRTALYTLVYHNNFIDNSVQAHVTGGMDNLFDNGYPSGGNHWSDYIGVDLYSGPNQDQPGKDRADHETVEPVLGHDSKHDHDEGSSGTGNLGRRAPKCRAKESSNDRRVNARLGRYSAADRKRHR